MKRMIAPTVVLAFALLTGAGALMAHARQPGVQAGNAAPNDKIGSVDMEEIYNASNAPKELDQAAQQDEADAAQRINKIMALQYLEPVELEEYVTLVGKNMLTPEEEKRSAALKTTSDQRAAELRSLETKGEGALTPADRTRLSHLTDLRVTMQSQVRPGLVAGFRSQHEGRMQDVRHRQIVQLRQEVAKVAKERGIAHVFDSGTLVYSANDLTATVLQRLAKRTGKR